MGNCLQSPTSDDISLLRGSDGNPDTNDASDLDSPPPYNQEQVLFLVNLLIAQLENAKFFHWKFIFSKQESLAPTSHGGPPSPLRPPNSSAPAPMLPHPPHSSAPRSGHHHHRDHSSRDQASFLGKCFHQVSFPRKKSHGSVIWIRIISSKSVKDGAQTRYYQKSLFRRR